MSGGGLPRAHAPDAGRCWNLTAPGLFGDLSGLRYVSARVAVGSWSGRAKHLWWLPLFEGGSPAIILDHSEPGTLSQVPDDEPWIRDPRPKELDPTW